MSSLEFRTSFGLEITIQFKMGYEDGGCGYPGYYVDEWYITHIGGRELKHKEPAKWLYKKLEICGDNERIEEKCIDIYNEGFDDYD